MQAVPSRYPLRVDVAKPAVVYQPSFGKEKDPLKPSPCKPSDNLSWSGSHKHSILGKRRRGGRTEFLIKWSGSAEPVWESSRVVSVRAVQDFDDKWQSRQLLESQLEKARHAKHSIAASGGKDAPIIDRSPIPYRILAQRRPEGGQRFLIHWAGQSVANASWESAKRINNPTLVHDFEQAVGPHPTQPANPCSVTVAAALAPSFFCRSLASLDISVARGPPLPTPAFVPA